MDQPQPPAAQIGTPGAGDSAEPGRPKPVRRNRWRSMRRYLVVGACALALLCGGVAAAGALYYDRATKPDLGSPEHVTFKYLEAYLIDRDDNAAKTYQCTGSSDLTDLQALRSDVDNREKRFSVAIRYSIEGVSLVSRTASDANVSVTLVLLTTLQGQSQRAVEHWDVATHNDGGWRVCRAHEVT